MSALFLLAAIICFVFAGFASNAPEWLLYLGLSLFAASFLAPRAEAFIRSRND